MILIVMTALSLLAFICTVITVNRYSTNIPLLAWGVFVLLGLGSGFEELLNVMYIPNIEPLEGLLRLSKSSFSLGMGLVAIRPILRDRQAKKKAGIKG